MDPGEFAVIDLSRLRHTKGKFAEDLVQGPPPHRRDFEKMFTVLEGEPNRRSGFSVPSLHEESRLTASDARPPYGCFIAGLAIDLSGRAAGQA